MIVHSFPLNTCMSVNNHVIAMEAIMLENIKARLGEAIEIADSCPEKYQSTCFEVVLTSMLMGSEMGDPQIPEFVSSRSEEPGFFARYGISEKQWTRVFHRNGDSFTVIVRELKVKHKSQKQVRLALLLGLAAIVEGNDTVITRDALVAACEEYAAYDGPNFAASMKRNKDLFIARGEGWTLTVPGRDKAAEVVQELGQ